MARLYPSIEPCGATLNSPTYVRAVAASGGGGGAAWAGYGLSVRGLEKALPALSEISFFSSGLGEKLLNINLLSSLISVLAAMVIYLLALLLTKTVTKDDVIGLPKGEKIVKALAKRGLLG